MNEIFNDIGKQINDLGDSFYTFIMDNWHNPFFWIISFAILAGIAFIAIRDIADK